MAYTGLGAGTTGDPFQITSVSEFKEMSGYTASYFKLMNNIDWISGGTFNITTFNSFLDGNGFELQNLPTGNVCFQLQTGCSINNIKLRFNRNSGSNYTLFNGYYTKTSCSITNITIVITDSARIYYIDEGSWWSTNCVINNIVIEGNIRGGFSGQVNCLMQNVKVLRTGLSTYTGIEVALVGILASEMRYCQVTIPLAMPNNGSTGYLVWNFSDGGFIKESFVKANIIATKQSGIEVVHGMVYKGYGAQYIQDSYFEGDVTINGGESTDNSLQNAAKSGYIISPHGGQKVERCYYRGKLVTPLNDNRTVLVKEYNTGSNAVKNCFYDKTKLPGITSKDIANQQTGLTTSEFTDSGNFPTWNFSTIWQMASDAPLLRNNLPHSFELKQRAMGDPVANVTRATGSSFNVDVFAYTFDNSVFGIDVLLNGSLVFNSENTLINIVNVAAQDGIYTIKAYWSDNSVKIYTGEVIYYHYAVDSAISATNVNVDSKILLSGSPAAKYVHGSCIYGNYIYGSTRNEINPSTAACITKAPLSNISQYVNIPIWAVSEGSGLFNYMEQLVVCGDYIYAIAQYGSSNCLLQFNPATNDYKVFQLSPWGVYTQPILSDGEFLYLPVCDFSRNTSIKKVNPLVFVQAPNKFNTSSVFAFDVIATYSANSQGGHIAGGYSGLAKGFVHSSCADANYLYLSFTTRNSDYADVNGYSVALNKNYHELHVVNKQTMQAAGWRFIPKSTDDMCQTDTHLFFGIEVQQNANINTYGYGWGNYAVRKIDLRLTALPKYHITDDTRIYADPSMFSSYASLIFGNYLLDAKTNQYTYIIDISDVDNWTINENIGARTLKCYKFYYLGVAFATDSIPNEFLLAESGKFYAFLWGGATPTSGIMQTELPGLSFFAVPTVNTVSGIANGSDVALTGYLLNAGGHTITSKGFRYGSAANNLNNSITSNETTLEFHALLQGLAAGTYYYQAYAINSLGESVAEIKSFVIANNIPIFIGSVQIQKIMLNAEEISFKV